jgi:hypothetical protein
VFPVTASTYSDHLPWTQNGSLDGFLFGLDITTVGDQMYQLDSLLPCEDSLPLVSPPEQQVSCDAMDMMWDSVFHDVNTPAAPVDLGFSDSIIDHNQRSPKPWEELHSAQLFANGQPDFQELSQTNAIPSTSSPMIGDTDVPPEKSLPVIIREGLDLVSASQPSNLHVPYRRRSKTKQDHSVVESRYRGTLNDRISNLRDLITQIFRDEYSPKPRCDQDGAFASKALVLSIATAQMRHYETSNQDLLVNRRKLEKRVRGLERQALRIRS